MKTCLIESNLVILCSNAFNHLPPRSLCKTDGNPVERNRSLSKALAAVVAVLSGTGIAQRKFEQGHTAVRIHLLPEGDMGNSPTKSTPRV